MKPADIVANYLIRSRNRWFVSGIIFGAITTLLLVLLVAS